jgi:hypothetical protein
MAQGATLASVFEIPQTQGKLVKTLHPGKGARQKGVNVMEGGWLKPEAVMPPNSIDAP